MNKLTAAALAALTTVLTVSACTSGATTGSSDPAVTESMSDSMATDEAMASESTMADESMASESMMDEESMSDDDSMESGMMSAGMYIDYEAYEMQMSEFAAATVVLFFHASWCPDCQATDDAVTADGVPNGLVVVKVDYDDSDELKQKYGITQQHTFVQIDGMGTELAKWTGSGNGEDILAQTT